MNMTKKKLNPAELFSRFGVFAIFLLVVLVASISSDRFFSVDNILSVFVQCTVVGVLACGMTEGLCALAGTGSDVFLIQNLKCTDTIGGWGYLLGDDGSGVWTGVHAARELAKAVSGMIPKTDSTTRT